MKDAIVLPFVKKKEYKDMTNEELTIEAERLEKKADEYSRTDREAMHRVDLELRKLDNYILDRYNAENDQWLSNHK